MNLKKYRVTLTEEERKNLDALTKKGKTAARSISRARILLHADASEQGPAWTDDKIQQALNVGLATIYRTLGALTEAGVLRTFPGREGEVAYRLCEPGHHHHLICEECGRIVEIPSCEVEEWASGVAQRRGFTATRHQADIFGLCSDCQRPTSRKPAR